MKRLISALLCIVLALAQVVSLSEDLSESEQQYLGSWVLYIQNGKTTYLYTISFFDDYQVTLKTLEYAGSTITSDHTSTGKWCGLTQNVIVLTLSGHDFAGSINDEGLFCLVDYKTKEASGFFCRCPDLSYLMI